MMHIDPCQTLTDFHRNLPHALGFEMPRRIARLGDFTDCTVHVHRGEITRVFGHLGSQMFQWYFAEDAKDGNTIEARLYRAAKEATDAT